MSRRLRCWALALSLLALTIPTMAAAPPARVARDAGGNSSTLPLGLRTEAGYQAKWFHGVPMQMGDVGLSVGFPLRKLDAQMYVGLHQSLGQSEYGLTVWETSGRALLDFPLGRLHLGVEPHAALLGVRRRSTSDTMHGLNFGLALVAGVDIVRTGERSVLQVNARGGVELLTSGRADRESDPQLGPWYALSLAFIL